MIQFHYIFLGMIFQVFYGFFGDPPYKLTIYSKNLHNLVCARHLSMHKTRRAPESLSPYLPAVRLERNQISDRTVAELGRVPRPRLELSSRHFFSCIARNASYTPGYKSAKRDPSCSGRRSVF